MGKISQFLSRWLGQTRVKGQASSILKVFEDASQEAYDSLKTQAGERFVASITRVLSQYGVETNESVTVVARDFSAKLLDAIPGLKFALKAQAEDIGMTQGFSSLLTNERLDRILELRRLNVSTAAVSPPPTPDFVQPAAPAAPEPEADDDIGVADLAPTAA